jgi:hypothetical protein
VAQREEIEMSDWTKVAYEETGDGGSPGSQYYIAEFTLARRGDRWRITVDAHWGSNQGYYQRNGSNETEGRGDSPEEACEAVRKDIFAWAGDNAETRAAYATALRKLCYAAEDEDGD